MAVYNKVLCANDKLVLIKFKMINKHHLFCNNCFAPLKALIINLESYQS